MIFFVSVSSELVVLFPRSRDVSTGESSRSEVYSWMTERLPLQLEIGVVDDVVNVGKEDSELADSMRLVTVQRLNRYIHSKVMTLHVRY